MTNLFLNLAGYKFIALRDLAVLREQLILQCNRFFLKGTILLSAEGINLNLAGVETDLRHFVQEMQSHACFQAMTYRESFSAFQPFKRLKIKLKKEIITLRQPSVQPEQNRAPAIPPAQLKTWLDEKREMTLLDTRNDYEMQFGTFARAQNLGLKNFSDFAKVLSKLEKSKPIVMFCTGGIRCEKAAIHLMQSGFTDIYQLEGGILNYFKEVGGEHYHGECFVFDERVALDHQLQPTGTAQCQKCCGPVPLVQQALATYNPGVSCPRCSLS